MDTVALEKKAELAIITLNRPEKLNAINHESADRLTEIAKDVDADDSIRVVIITGTGERAFSSGSDISELRGISGLELRKRIESRPTNVQRSPRTQTLARHRALPADPAEDFPSSR